MVLTDNLVSYYKCDTNGSFPDAHGSNNGTINGATYTASGKINGAYDFDGTNDSITFGDLSSNFTTEGSINLWVKLDNATPSNANQTGFISIQGGANSDHYPYTNGLAYLNAFRTIRVDGINLSSSVTRTDFHMVTITSEPGSNGWKLYQNGSLVHQTTGDANVSVGSNIKIGQSIEVTRNFDGIKDEVGIWNRALTSTEVSELYNAGAGLQYPFVVSSGLTIFGIEMAKVHGVEFAKMNGV